MRCTNEYDWEKFCARARWARQTDMKTRVVIMATLGWIAGIATAAEESFSRAIQPADFGAAGLSKLTPEELARLDALVRDYKSGALEAARREAAAAAKAKAEAEARAAKAEADARKTQAESEARTARAEEARHKAEARAQAAETEPKKADKSLLSRAKVLLMPGTEIEYATIESTLVGDFKGWDGRTVFTLENGQRWQSEGGSYLEPRPIPHPAVKISPGALGAFFMTIEGVKPRVKVKLLSGGR